MYSVNDIILIITAATIPVSISLIIINRIMTKKGIGVRAIQFTALCIMIPTIIILSINEVLDRSAVGAMIGAIFGYLFANISKFDDRQNDGS